MTASEEIRCLTDRVVALEEWVMHTDRLLASLNEVVCAFQDRLDEQARRHQAVQDMVARIALPETETRKFEDERPPHY